MFILSDLIIRGNVAGGKRGKPFFLVSIISQINQSLRSEVKNKVILINDILDRKLLGYSNCVKKFDASTEMSSFYEQSNKSLLL